MSRIVALIAESVQGNPTIIENPKGVELLEALQKGKGYEVWYIEGDVAIDDVPNLIANAGYTASHRPETTIAFWNPTEIIKREQDVISVNGNDYILNTLTIRY